MSVSSTGLSSKFLSDNRPVLSIVFLCMLEFKVVLEF